MKIKHIWSVLCKESVINQDDNVMSLIGILEELNSTLTPMKANLPRPEKISIPFNFEIVSYWTKDLEKEFRMEVKTAVVDPSGKEISSVINESVFPKNVMRLRSRLKVQGISLTTSGRYYFRITMKTNKEKSYQFITELPLDVKINIEKPKISSN